MTQFPYVNQQNDRLLRGWRPPRAIVGMANMLGVDTATCEARFRRWADTNPDATYRTMQDLSLAFAEWVWREAEKNPSRYQPPKPKPWDGGEAAIRERNRTESRAFMAACDEADARRRRGEYKVPQHVRQQMAELVKRCSG